MDATNEQLVTVHTLLAAFAKSRYGSFFLWVAMLAAVCELNRRYEASNICMSSIMIWLSL